MSCCVTPIMLTLFQSSVHPRNSDGTLMQIGDVLQDDTSANNDADTIIIAQGSTVEDNPDDGI